jgi:hypothetical protein
MIKESRLALDEVAGEHNPTDLSMKGLSADRIAYLMDMMGYSYL